MPFEYGRLQDEVHPEQVYVGEHGERAAQRQQVLAVVHVAVGVRALLGLVRVVRDKDVVHVVAIEEGARTMPVVGKILIHGWEAAGSPRDFNLRTP
jgi:hypothetical protein